MWRSAARDIRQPPMIELRRRRLHSDLIIGDLINREVHDLAVAAAIPAFAVEVVHTIPHRVVCVDAKREQLRRFVDRSCVLVVGHNAGSDDDPRGSGAQGHDGVEAQLSL